MMGSQLGLALGGGGARGLAHIGVLKVLEREQIPIGMIVGSSIGAVVGGMYGKLKSAAAVEAFSLEMVESPLLRKIGLDFFDETGMKKPEGRLDDILTFLKMRFSLLRILNKPSFFDRDVVNELYRDFDDADIEALMPEFAAVATDLISGEEIVITRGNLKQALMASSAIPGIFPPVERNGQLLVDGGASDTVPVHVLRDRSKNPVLAVDVSRNIRIVGSLSNALYIIYRADEITSYLLTQKRLAEADLIIRPPVQQFSWADFKHAQQLIRLGEEATQQMLPQILTLQKKKHKISPLYWWTQFFEKHRRKHHASVKTSDG